MKKIVILLVLTFLLTSCFWEKKEVVVKKETKETEIKNSFLNTIPKGDIRNNTKYSENFIWLQNSYFNKNNDIWLLLSYIWNLEYQWFDEKKEKEYAEIIIKMWEEFIKKVDKKEIKLKDYEKTYLLPLLYNKIWNNYEIIEKNNEAITFYQKSINLNNNYYKSLIYLWNLYKKIWEKEKYDDSFEKVIKIIKSKKEIENIENNFKIFKNNYWWYTDLWVIYKILWNNKLSKVNFDKAENIINNNKDIYINEYEYKKMLFNFNKIKSN